MKTFLLFAILALLFVFSQAQTSSDIKRKAQIEQKSRSAESNQNIAIKQAPAWLYVSVLNSGIDTTNKNESFEKSLNIKQVINIYTSGFNERQKEFRKHLGEINSSITNLNQRYNSIEAIKKNRNSEAKILMVLDSAEINIDAITKLYKNIDSLCSQYNANSTLTPLSHDSLKLISQPYLKDLDTLDKKIQNDMDSVFKEIKKTLILLKQIRLKTDEETSKEKEIEPILKPAFIANSNSFKLIPSINVLASKTTINNEAGHSISLCLFSSPTLDTSYLNDKSNYFIPQASNLGFGLDYVKNFKSVTNKSVPDTNASIMSLKFSGYYLSKKLAIKDSADGIGTISTIGQLHALGGIEYSFRSVFSLTGNLHVTTTVNGRDAYVDYFNTNSVVTAFWDLGIKTDFYLDKKSTDHHFLLCLNFILVNNSTKKIFPTRDYVIPTISISYFEILSK